MKDWSHPVPEQLGLVLPFETWLKILIPSYAQLVYLLSPWRGDTLVERDWSVARDRFDEFARNAPTPAALNAAWRELVANGWRIIEAARKQREREQRLRRVK